MVKVKVMSNGGRALVMSNGGRALVMTNEKGLSVMCHESCMIHAPSLSCLTGVRVVSDQPWRGLSHESRMSHVSESCMIHAPSLSCITGV